MKERNYGIDALRVLGILLIVLNHVVQTLGTPHLFPDSKYCFDLGVASSDSVTDILTFLRGSGPLGNTLFLLCSAWFLIDSNSVNKRKILQFLMDIWTISVLILLAVIFLGRVSLGPKMIVQQLFPTTFANNWFMTCYVLFYPLHPFLNKILRGSSQKQLLVGVIVSFVLYFVVNWIFPALFFPSMLIYWTVVYLLLGYLKLYLNNVMNKPRVSLTILACGVVGQIVGYFATNSLSLQYDFLDGKVMRWAENNDPFVLMIALGLVFFFGNSHFKRSLFCFVSQLSMLVYVIHENILLREHCRPQMWQYIYDNYGYDHIFLWVGVMFILVFLFGLLGAILYKYTIQKVVTKVGDWIYPRLSRWGSSVLERIMAIGK